MFFYIDPEFETDPRMDGINNLILSYTFFKVSEEWRVHLADKLFFLNLQCIFDYLKVQKFYFYSANFFFICHAFAYFMLWKIRVMISKIFQEITKRPFPFIFPWGFIFCSWIISPMTFISWTIICLIIFKIGLKKWTVTYHLFSSGKCFGNLRFLKLI